MRRHVNPNMDIPAVDFPLTCTDDKLTAENWEGDDLVFRLPDELTQYMVSAGADPDPESDADLDSAVDLAADADTEAEAEAEVGEEDWLTDTLRLLKAHKQASASTPTPTPTSAPTSTLSC